MNGRLSADAEPRNVGNGRGAAGGSLWIRGGALSGTGVISASGANGYNSTIAGGGGGRIDLSETVNNFAGQINVLGGCWNNDNTYRGLAGTVVFPQTAGTGLTMQNFVPYTNIAIGGGVTLSSVLVNPGITLWLEANGADHVYTMDSLVVTGTATSVGQVICRGNISQANAASGGSAAVPHGRGVVIECRSLVIHPYGLLHARGQGFGGGFGPGRSPATGYGATHGGLGGSYSPYTYELPPHYGAPLSPSALGSGGNAGGPGGGAISLDISETLIVSGQLTADAPKSTGSNSGGGAGGSIWIRAPRLQGGGLISASGGDGVSTAHGGGGGGRIDLSATINDFSGGLRVWGGHPTFRNPLRGKTGTMRLPQSAGSGLTINAFVVTNVVRLGEDLNLSRVEVRPGGTLFLDAQTNRWAYSFDSLTLTGTVTSAASVVCLSDFHAVNPVSGGLVTNRHGRGVTIQADAVTVGPWCSIEAIGSGFVGNNGPGRSEGQINGGSYGGRGSRLTGTGVCYGVASAPTALGSGGGTSASAAGGAIRFIVGTLTNNGLISASAGVSTRNHAGASGGSLWLQCGELTGSGSLQALGCTANNNHAGGGGRIAVLLDDASQSALSMSASAAGGLRNNDVKLDAAAGTVFFRNIADPASPGLLRFDNPGRTTVDPVWTELPPRLVAVDAAVAESVLLLTNSAHVGLTSDCLVKDLFLRTGSLLRLNGYTLRVDSYRHPDWGSDAWVDYGGGEILWRGGTVIIVH